MVPNHMGIDSHWVIEHPEWFLSLPEPPYPGYTFGGGNLGDDDRVEVCLEDHYWDNSDAAVVFKRLDRWSGERRYIYHGNDGTSLPWNDTAQLDFSRADVREQVIQTILARGPPLPGHPVRRSHGAGPQARPAAVVPGAGRGRRRDPVARRARA